MNSGNNNKDLRIVLLFSFVVSILAFYIYFSDYDLNSKKSVFHSFFFEKNSGYKTKTGIFFNFEDGKYVIPSYAKASFFLEDFNKRIKGGDTLSIVLDDDNSIYQITKEKYDFIDYDKRIELENTNNKIALIVGCVFIFFCFVIISMLIFGKSLHLALVKK